MGDCTEQILRQVHQVIIARISPIELKHGKFRIVARRQTFIPEIPIQLKYFFISANSQTFQKKLRRDS